MTRPIPPSRRKVLMKLAALVVADAALVACGGGGTDDSAPAPTPTPAPAPAPAPNPKIEFLAGAVRAATDASRCVPVDGLGDAARFGDLADMAVAADGTVFVLEQPCSTASGFKLRQIDGQGRVTTRAEASTVLPTQRPNSFIYPSNIALGPDGSVYISERVRGFDIGTPTAAPEWQAPGVWKLNGTSISILAGIQSGRARRTDGVGTAAEFYGEPRLVFGNGALYADDTGVARRISADGTVTTVDMPRPIIADNAGVLYVGDYANTYLQEFGGTRRIDLSDSAIKNPQLAVRPRLLAVAADGSFYSFHSSAPTAVFRFLPDGSKTPVLGTADGQTYLRAFTGYLALGLDASGRLYVLADQQLWRVTF